MNTLHVCWIALTSFNGMHNRNIVKVNDVVLMQDQEPRCERPNRTLVLLRDGITYICVEEFLVEIEQKIKETCK